MMIDVGRTIIAYMRRRIHACEEEDTQMMINVGRNVP
jgi:hypothetical protein